MAAELDFLVAQELAIQIGHAAVAGGIQDPVGGELFDIGGIVAIVGAEHSARVLDRLHDERRFAEIALGFVFALLGRVGHQDLEAPLFRREFFPIRAFLLLLKPGQEKQHDQHCVHSGNPFARRCFPYVILGLEKKLTTETPRAQRRHSESRCVFEDLTHPTNYQLLPTTNYYQLPTTTTNFSRLRVREAELREVRSQAEAWERGGKDKQWPRMKHGRNTDETRKSRSVFRPCFVRGYGSSGFEIRISDFSP